MWVVSCDGFKIKDVNKSGCKLFEQKRSELCGSLFVNLFPGCKRRLQGHTRSKSKTFRDFGIFACRLEGNKQLEIRMSCKNITYAGKSCWLIVTTDITESRRTERLSKDFHDAIVSSSIVSRADISGQITFVNDNFIRISGYSKEELIGSTHRIINSQTHPRSFWINMWKAISAGKTWRAEVRNKAKDGSYYWVDTFVMPFVSEDGKVREYLSIRNDITDRKKHEEEILGLVKLLSDFNFAINNASIVSRADRAGNITYINSNFVKISGYDSRELIGQNHRIINSDFHPKSFWVDMWKTISSGQTWRSEVRNRAKDGSFYWVDTFIMPFVDENGTIKEYLSIRNDITKRKSQEDEIIALNQSLAEFQQAINNSSIVSKADRNGDITYVNKNFERISGYTEAELLGKNHRIINSGHHSKQFWISMWKTIAAGQMWRGDVKNRAKDGSHYWVDTFVMPLLDGNGKPKEYLSIRNDITAKKKAKEELDRMNQNLSETLIFGEMGSAELDIKTFQVKLSKELLNLLGEQAESHKVMPLNKFISGYIAPEYIGIVQEKIAEGMSSYSDVKRIVEVEFEMRTALGKRIWINAKGIFKGDSALGIFHDISDEKKAIATISESELKYKLLHEKKEMLIKEIHHRVKNNLQLISSMLYLKMLACDNNESHAFMTSMREKIKSVSLIHERLLQTGNLNSIDISEYIQKLLHDIQVTYYREDLKLEIRTNIDNLNFSSDYATYLGQLINELVINAIKHGFRDRSSGEISISLQKNVSVFELIVEDDGVGFPEGKIAIKENSYGMQLVQIFVQQMKGRLEVTHRRGTCFKIEFTEK